MGGVAISAALFQTVLNTELHKRIHREDAEEVCGPPTPLITQAHRGADYHAHQALRNARRAP